MRMNKEEIFLGMRKYLQKKICGFVKTVLPLQTQDADYTAMKSTFSVGGQSADDYI